MNEHTKASEFALPIDGGAHDPLEDEVRRRVRGFIETILEEELEAALGRRRYQRSAESKRGQRNGHRERQVVGTFGPETVKVPRARLVGEDGQAGEWRSKSLRRYQRLTKKAEALIAAGVDVNTAGDDGPHVLPFAIVSGRDEFALFLLEQGADPNGRMGGVSALHAAAGGVSTWLADWSRRHGRAGGRLSARGRLALVEALLAGGADPNARITSSAMLMFYIGYPKKGAFDTFAPGTGDLRGATPLWVAAYASNRSDNTEVVQALLEAGADQHLTTDDGTTPLMAAAGLGRCTYRPREPRGPRSPSAEEAVRVLLEAGADVNAVNEADFTALHAAAFRGQNEVVTYLVEQGAAVDARDFRGRTAFRMAEGAKQSFQFQSWPETAALLKALGADTRLGIPGTVQERLRDVPVGADLPR